jgi:hypothetical protein
MSLSNYQTFVGGPSFGGYVQVKTGANAIDYPSPDIVDVFGPIYTPRLYAKDLTAMEIASSGGVSFAVNDARALDIYDTADATLVAAYNPADTSSNNSYISFHKSLKTLKLFGKNGIEIGEQTGGNISLTSTSNQSFNIGGCNSVVIKSSGLHVNGDITSANNTILLGSNDAVTNELLKSNMGIRVWGRPTNILQNDDARYIKSLTWNPGTNGTLDLGNSLKASTESFWEVRGGHLRLTHCKDSSGSRKVSYVMRINDKDELEFVKMTMSNNVSIANKVIAKFGFTSNSIV